MSCGSAGTTTEKQSVGKAAALGPQQPARVVNATVVGPVDANQQIDLMIGLDVGHGDPTALATHIARTRDKASPDYKKVLTPAQFGDLFAISQADYDGLVAKLQGMGFTITQATPSRTTLSFHGPAHLVEQLFGTQLLTYRDAPGSVWTKREGSDTFRAPSDKLSFAAFGPYASVVKSVVGLDNASTYHSFARRVSKKAGTGQPAPAQPMAPASPTEPQEAAWLRTRYGVDTVNGPNGLVQGAGQTIALLGTGYAPVASDLDGFTAHAGLGNWRTHYIQAFMGGATRDSDSLSSNEEFENVLDADMALGVAPLASVVHVITATNNPGLFDDGITFIVNQVPQAHQASVSFGTCERGQGYYEVTSLNALFQQAIAQGQTWFFSSGDDGTDSCRDASSDAVLTVNWPASSPYVYAVGGTQITAAGVEDAWGVGNASGGGGGGGQSELFDKPDYQIGVGPYPNDGARDLPDISALAGDPGVYIYAGGDSSAEGTSAASPIVASIWAMLYEARGPGASYISHADVYAAGKAGGNFTDVVAGNNSDGTTPGYDAIAGFDLATGWGTPILNKLVGAF